MSELQMQHVWKKSLSHSILSFPSNYPSLEKINWSPKLTLFPSLLWLPENSFVWQIYRLWNAHFIYQLHSGLCAIFFYTSVPIIPIYLLILLGKFYFITCYIYKSHEITLFFKDLDVGILKDKSIPLKHILLLHPRISDCEDKILSLPWPLLFSFPHPNLHKILEF